MTNLVFFGSSEFSVIILNKLISLADFKISLVVTKADKPVGRDQTITSNPVAKFAADHQLPLLQIENFDKNCKLKIKNSQAQLGLCVAFGPPFFDQELIDIFLHKIVNIHPSPLPKYRGATPGPWQIINGETSSTVTFFQIDLLPDHGPIIAQIPFEISPHETSQSFYQKAFTLAAENLHKILLPPTTVQDESQRSYFPKLTKDMAKIDWSKPIDYTERFIRAMLPWPVAWTQITDKNNKILKMKIYSSKINKGKGNVFFRAQSSEVPTEGREHEKKSLPSLNDFVLENVQIEGKNPTTWPEISQHYSLKL